MFVAKLLLHKFELIVALDADLVLFAAAGSFDQQLLLGRVFVNLDVETVLSGFVNFVDSEGDLQVGDRVVGLWSLGLSERFLE